jgi:hypothetical protein
MPKLREALKQTSGTDVGGNEFTLTETDIQPYIDNPDMAQMEANVTQARYGGTPVKGSPPGGPQTAGGKPGPGSPVDFSRRGAFEQSVFKQLQSDSMPNGNPFDFDTTATMNEITKTDMPELFAQVFQNQVTWQDRHLLDDDQKKYWTGEVKAFRAHLKDSLDSEKNEGVDMYNQMMNQFDNMAKEQESLRKRKRQKGLDVAKAKETRGKAQAANLKRRNELLTDIREATVMIMDAKSAGTLSEAEAGAMAAELQGKREELKVINANLRGPRKAAPKPKGDVQNASADGEKSPAGKTIVRKKMPKQGKTVVAKSESPGLITKGNIDIDDRPVVQNKDGSVSTESSISIGTDDGEVLIPTIIDGKRVSEKRAIAIYESTGKHLGIFKDVESADKYAKSLHERQGKKSEKAIVKTGTVKSGPNKGRKKIIYEDGSTAYADEIK